MREIFEAISDEYMQSFGFFGSNDLTKIKAELKEYIASVPNDLRLISRKAVEHSDDWVINEPVTVSGRYTAYSPSRDIEASVRVVVTGAGAHIDRKSFAVV